MIRKRKQLKGSVLVFSLIVLLILLSLTITAATLVIFSKGSSRSTEKSIIAFQVADGAAENLLRFLYDYTEFYETPDALADDLYGTGTNGTGKPTCSNGVISGKLPNSSGTYAVTLLENDSDTKLDCDGYATYCEWRVRLAHMVATGTYAGATRAIDVAVELPDPLICP
jgi:Tfp pilus assembly protein PilX